MYNGIHDEVIIVSNQKISPGKRSRIVPVRTIAGLDIEPGPGGNVITVRTHGGETLRATHLMKKSSRKLYDTVRRSMEANDEEKRKRKTEAAHPRCLREGRIPGTVDGEEGARKAVGWEKKPPSTTPGGEKIPYMSVSHKPSSRGVGEAVS